ncbi:hypothetical protein MX659_02175 [Coriobacteriia bacterium Es71-Z0120]|nr:hypothetical protein [Parvivirga hydrogeniphila]MCL4078413.1 hypothetical protein [Parvivirga hydrogeniphila]
MISQALFLVRDLAAAKSRVAGFQPFDQWYQLSDASSAERFAARSGSADFEQRLGRLYAWLQRRDDIDLVILPKSQVMLGYGQAAIAAYVVSPNVSRYSARCHEIGDEDVVAAPSQRFDMAEEELHRQARLIDGKGSAPLEQGRGVRRAYDDLGLDALEEGAPVKPSYRMRREEWCQGFRTIIERRLRMGTLRATVHCSGRSKRG